MKEEIKELNNKTRQGRYIYLKAKNHKSRYFKIKGMMPTAEEWAAARKYYEDRTMKGKEKGQYQQYVKAFQKAELTSKPNKAMEYLKQIKRKGTIQSKINKGKTETTFNKAQVTSMKPSEINKVILGKLLKSETNNEIAHEHNMQKIKHKIENKVTMFNEKGETVLIAKAYNKTIKETAQDIQDTVSTEQYMDKDEYKGRNSAVKRIEAKGYNVSDIMNSGKIVNYTITTTLRNV